MVVTIPWPWLACPTVAWPPLDRIGADTAGEETFTLAHLQLVQLPWVGRARAVLGLVLITRRVGAARARAHSGGRVQHQGGRARRGAPVVVLDWWWG